jgi:hypothetical protein
MKQLTDCSDLSWVGHLSVSFLVVFYTLSRKMSGPSPGTNYSNKHAPIHYMKQNQSHNTLTTSTLTHLSALTCGLSNVRDTRALTPLFSAVLTWTHTSSCWPWKGPLDTNLWCRLAAPVAWGSTLDTHTPSLRTFCEPACYTTGEVDLQRTLHEGARFWNVFFGIMDVEQSPKNSVIPSFYLPS